MSKHFFIAAFLLAFAGKNAAAQYYYKDIVSVKQGNDENKLLQQQKIRGIAIHSFDPGGKESEDFKCQKKISKDFRTVETIASSPGTAASTVVSEYNEKGQLVKYSDSSEITAASTVYEYDAKGNINRIVSYNHSSDDDFTTSLKEIHEYTYNENGQPAKMLRIKNDIDTMQVDFVIDENGNVSDEIERVPHGKHYYYYYNDKKQLTDIVRYNIIARAMKPDIVFEYNDKGQLVQMVTVEEGTNKSFYNEKDVVNYYTWRYFYNDEGLRIIEKCFARSNQLLGYVEYEYE